MCSRMWHHTIRYRQHTEISNTSTMSSGHAISSYVFSATSVVLYLATLPVQLHVVLSAQNMTTVTYSYSTFQSLHYKSSNESRTTLLVVCGLKKFQRPSEDLYKLHWLLVRQRIHYKIAIITYRALHEQQPTYI